MLTGYGPGIVAARGESWARRCKAPYCGTVTQGGKDGFLAHLVTVHPALAPEGKQ